MIEDVNVEREKAFGMLSACCSLFDLDRNSIFGYSEEKLKINSVKINSAKFKL